MRALFVVTRLPDINGQADQFTTAQAIKYLANRGVRVDVCVLKASSYTSTEFLFEAAIGIFKLRPLQTSLYENAENRNKIKRFIDGAAKYDRVYCHLIRAMVVNSVIENKKIFLGMQISQGLNFSRIARELPFGFKKLLYFLEAKLSRKYEREIVEKVHKTNFVGTQDPEFLGLSTSKAITTIPHGIDLDFSIAPKNGKDLIFLANFSSEANKAAFHLLVEEIMPKIVKCYPNVVLSVCGRNMPDSFKTKESKNIQIVGQVDDALSEISMHQILLNPVRAAAGMQNKVLAGLAAGVLVVSFKSAVAGMRLPYSTCKSVDDSVESFVEAVCANLNDYPSQEALDQTKARVKEDWSWDFLHEKWASEFLEIGPELSKGHTCHINL